MERYLLKYLLDSTQDEWHKRYYDYMRFLFDQKLWLYGRHMNRDLESDIERKNNVVLRKNKILTDIYGICYKDIKKKIKTLLKIDNNKKGIYNAPSEYQYKVLSIFRYPWLSEDAIRKLNAMDIEFDYINDKKNKIWTQSVARLQQWYNSALYVPFNQLLDDKYVCELKEIYDELALSLKECDYDAVLVHTAEIFEAKILIDIFREHGKISIEMTHGVPAANPLIEDRVDFLLVYGEAIRKNCIAKGYNPRKIFVAGNAKNLQDNVIKTPKLRCSLEDVLVVTSATSVGNQHEWNYELFPINDRSLLITYLYSVENVLKRNNVQHARLRPHPIVNKEWISQYIDTDFYELDYLPLEKSLEQATCCIGQNSTTVFEALMYGVSFLVYEPGDGLHAMAGNALNPPFDGSDERMKVANTEEELSSLIQSRYCPSAHICEEYIEPFKPEIILDILSNLPNISK